PHLVATFLHRLKVEQQYDAQLTPEALDFLARANWPGQIRELESTVRTVVAREAAQQSLDGAASAPALITLEAVRSYLEQRALGFGGSPVPLLLPMTGSPSMDTLAPVRKRPSALTVEDIQEALVRQGGNKTRTAADLGIALNTLKARMKALGLA
ncbi:MAG TPA: helix-turn-helix domain-containing protein, partial [Cystobacter sp.]